MPRRIDAVLRRSIKRSTITVLIAIFLQDRSQLNAVYSMISMNLLKHYVWDLLLYRRELLGIVARSPLESETGKI